MQRGLGGFPHERLHQDPLPRFHEGRINVWGNPRRLYAPSPKFYFGAIICVCYRNFLELNLIDVWKAL